MSAKNCFGRSSSEIIYEGFNKWSNADMCSNSYNDRKGEVGNILGECKNSSHLKKKIMNTWCKGIKVLKGDKPLGYSCTHFYYWLGDIISQMEDKDQDFNVTMDSIYIFIKEVNNSNNSCENICPGITQDDFKNLKEVFDYWLNHTIRTKGKLGDGKQCSPECRQYVQSVKEAYDNLNRSCTNAGYSGELCTKLNELFSSVRGSKRVPDPSQLKCDKIPPRPAKPAVQLVSSAQPAGTVQVSKHSDLRSGAQNAKDSAGKETGMPKAEQEDVKNPAESVKYLDQKESKDHQDGEGDAAAGPSVRSSAAVTSSEGQAQHDGGPHNNGGAAVTGGATSGPSDGGPRGDGSPRGKDATAKEGPEEIMQNAVEEITETVDKPAETQTQKARDTSLGESGQYGGSISTAGSTTVEGTNIGASPPPLTTIIPSAVGGGAAVALPVIGFLLYKYTPLFRGTGSSPSSGGKRSTRKRRSTRHDFDIEPEDSMEYSTANSIYESTEDSNEYSEEDSEEDLTIGSTTDNSTIYDTQHRRTRRTNNNPDHPRNIGYVRM